MHTSEVGMMKMLGVMLGMICQSTVYCEHGLCLPYVWLISVYLNDSGVG